MKFGFSLLKGRQLRLLLLTIVVGTELVACATPKSSKDSSSEAISMEDKSPKKKRNNKRGRDMPANYGLYSKNRDLDRTILRRGKQAMYSPALDSY